MNDWLQWQERLHSQPIDLGLVRVMEVATRLGVEPAAPVISVAGTNGKGSTVRYLESIYNGAGYRVGAYTSPHLLRYNERVRIASVEVGDDALCTAFAAVEQARADTSLTYFEFGTLAAFWLFARAGVDAWLLEVGLGGRLDAVNCVDADVAIITSIGLDHQDWLGPDRESIAREKAGIMRTGRLAICGDPLPPQALIQAAVERQTPMECLGIDFHAEAGPAGMRWRKRDADWQDWPGPGIAGGAAQIANAACALRAVDALQTRLPVAADAIGQGLAQARLAGRIQIAGAGPEFWLDVGHNPDALARLAGQLRDRPATGRVLAIVGMLRDKAITESIAVLKSDVDRWFPATLAGPRALPAGELAAMLQPLLGARNVAAEASVTSAIDAAMQGCAGNDRLLVFGSFLTVAEALRHPALAASAVPGAANQ